MRVYVLDASVAVEYPDIIPDSEEVVIFDNASIDLTSAHIVIPEHTVIKLSLLKGKGGETGQAASEALRRIRKLFNNSCAVTVGKQTFSTQRFCNKEYVDMPFVMDDSDIGAWIILSAIDIKNADKSCDVTLLTNDDALAIRANMHGIDVSKYFRKVHRYTGRRDLIVPTELFDIFWNEQEIPIEAWQYYMPNEPELIANEFIVMHDSKTRRTTDYCQRFDNIGRYDMEKRSIVGLEYAYKSPVDSLSAGQAIYAEALMNPAFKAVICTGPAGTGKTYLATVYAIESCKAGQFLRGVVVPCSPRRNSLGALPGSLSEKLDPNVQPIKNAIRNWLLNTNKGYKKELDNLRKYGLGSAPDSSRSKKGAELTGLTLLERIEEDVENKFRKTFRNPIHIDSARGRDFSYQVVIYDEFQDQDFTEADTLIKRLGKDGKMIITGDVKQVHATDKGLNEARNGIVFAKEACMNNPEVAVVDLYTDEIVRSDLVRSVVERQEESTNVTRLLVG